MNKILYKQIFIQKNHFHVHAEMSRAARKKRKSSNILTVKNKDLIRSLKIQYILHFFTKITRIEVLLLC